MLFIHSNKTVTEITALLESINIISLSYVMQKLSYQTHTTCAKLIVGFKGKALREKDWWFDELLFIHQI